LHWAAEKGKLDVVKYLIDEKKADFNVKAKNAGLLYIVLLNKEIGCS